MGLQKDVAETYQILLPAVSALGVLLNLDHWVQDLTVPKD